MIISIFREEKKDEFSIVQMKYLGSLLLAIITYPVKFHKWDLERVERTQAHYLMEVDGLFFKDPRLKCNEST